MIHAIKTAKLRIAKTILALPVVRTENNRGQTTVFLTIEKSSPTPTQPFSVKQQ